MVRTEAFVPITRRIEVSMHMQQTSMRKLTLFFLAEFHSEEIHYVEVELLQRFLPVSLSALWKENFGLSEEELEVFRAYNKALDSALREFSSGPRPFLFTAELGNPNQESYFFSSSASTQIMEMIEDEKLSIGERIALENAADALFVTYKTELNLRSSRERCKAS